MFAASYGWGGGIVGDDTHGHVDDVARFVNPTTIVVATERDRTDENYETLRENRKRLARMTDLRGRSLTLVPLPMPQPIFFDGVRLPASYANFYIANRCVLVPTFNDPSDRIALTRLARLFPDLGGGGHTCGRPLARARHRPLPDPAATPSLVRPALLIAHIWPICSLFAPCRPRASPASILNSVDQAVCGDCLTRTSGNRPRAAGDRRRPSLATLARTWAAAAPQLCPWRYSPERLQEKEARSSRRR